MKEVKRFEIWSCDLGKGFGSEQGGNRPVLVVQNNIGNKFSPTVVVLPITSHKKKFNATHVEIDCLREPSTVLCEQIRVVDKSRLKTKICDLPMKYKDKVDTTMRLQLGI